MLFIALSTLILTAGCLYAQHAHYAHVTSQRAHVDTIALADHLEAKLAEVAHLRADFDATKAKVEQLLLSTGLARSLGRG